jgi:hypothetical protein
VPSERSGDRFITDRGDIKALEDLTLEEAHGVILGLQHDYLAAEGSRRRCEELAKLGIFQARPRGLFAILRGLRP